MRREALKTRDFWYFPKVVNPALRVSSYIFCVHNLSYHYPVAQPGIFNEEGFGGGPGADRKLGVWVRNAGRFLQFFNKNNAFL